MVDHGNPVLILSKTRCKLGLSTFLLIEQDGTVWYLPHIPHARVSSFSYPWHPHRHEYSPRQVWGSSNNASAFQYKVAHAVCATQCPPRISWHVRDRLCISGDVPPAPLKLPSAKRATRHHDVLLIQASSSLSPQIPSESNVHAVFER